MSRLLVQARRHDARFELNVDFSVDNGTLVLFGASGAGKTSTLHAIAGLLALDGGRIQVDDTVYYDASQSTTPGLCLPELRALPTPDRPAEHRLWPGQPA